MQMRMRNYGLTYSVIILILLIVICNISKYIYMGEEFQNNSNSNTSPIQTNPIIPIYCPLEHPHIPCNLVKVCDCKTT